VSVGWALDKVQQTAAAVQQRRFESPGPLLDATHLEALQNTRRSMPFIHRLIGCGVRRGGGPVERPVLAALRCLSAF
jgi:hypothetical protein